MKKHRRWSLFPILLAPVVSPVVGIVSVQAANISLGPGQTMVLDHDIALDGTDEFDAEGTADQPCVIEGQGFGFGSVDGWNGRFVSRYCTFHSVGTVDVLAINIQIGTGPTAEVTLESNTFDASGGLSVAADEGVTIRVVGNTVLENSVVSVLMDSATSSVPAMTFSGYANTTAKVFQGNRIFRSGVLFDNVQNWLIGGANPGEGNIIIGDRGSIAVSRGTGFHIVGNYVRNPGDLVGWNQVKPLTLVDTDAVLIEHNVVRDGNWLMDLGGNIEARYNLVSDSHDRPLLLIGNGEQKIHHNIFMRTDPNFGTDGVWVLHTDATSVQIFNNTFNGGGKCWQRTGPAVAVEPDAFLVSLRSNAIFGFAVNLGSESAIVRGGGPERGAEAGAPPYEPKDPPPVRLGYTDYNLFYNPETTTRDNYALAVADKRERLDPGFALNDLPRGGSLDAEVDPMFAGGSMIPVAFAYSDDDVKAGNATVCQILRFYRRLFSPGPGSPLVGAGDPADGAGNNIGAIGGADDQFGTLCASEDEGSPNLGPDAFKCPVLPPGSGPEPVGGTTTAPPVGRELVCVCQEASGPPRATVVGTLALALACLALRRPRPRRRRAGVG